MTEPYMPSEIEALLDTANGDINVHDERAMRLLATLRVLWAERSRYVEGQLARCFRARKPYVKPTITTARLDGIRNRVAAGAWLTVADVAALLGVHADTVRRLCRAGRLEAVRLGGRAVRISGESVARLTGGAE